MLLILCDGELEILRGRKISRQYAFLVASPTENLARHIQTDHQRMPERSATVNEMQWRLRKEKS
ncbi:hypothetical protein Csa_017494 [Cucumis sativus]|nr:hypothetical protein Csa_017494 [Cucumis sativus]